MQNKVDYPKALEMLVQMSEHFGDYTFTEKEFESDLPQMLLSCLDIVLTEKNNLQAALDFNNQAIVQFLNGIGETRLADVCYQLTNIPIILEDLGFNYLYSIGLDPELARQYSRNLKKIVKNNHDGDNINLAELIEKQQIVELVQSDEHKRLIAPMISRGKIVGYCSFINTSFNEVDWLKMKQLYLIGSVSNYNKETILDTELKLNIKGGLLEDMIQNRLNPVILFKRARYIGVDLGQEYQFLVLKGNTNFYPNGKDPIGGMNLIEAFSRYFMERNLNILISEGSQNIAALLPVDLFLKYAMSVDKFIRKLLGFLKEKYPDIPFKIGMSSRSKSLEDIPILYNEALISLNLNHEKKEIMYFDDLGAVGILFRAGKTDDIRHFCNKMLSKLLEYDRGKESELTKTLYYYIKSGQNICKSAEIMNLSIGGLRYRVKKIGEILDADIHDLQTSYQLFLALQAGIILGDLKIE
ncbi:CdaR family transcriptional regulator [Bacillus sp. EB600]|uniref:PucR family transcriptional regulator n=1 Tax=Bacillus sp. EB600 TaxID=2806345 RepID=UPI00210B7B9B|nr:helix-turn-helix domain-containing protein [Bacillus sp. EB600]MCQ6282099.1 helix-turn-helix domain-containing protein [Bacillus sp. EB600]